MGRSHLEGKEIGMFAKLEIFSNPVVANFVPAPLNLLQKIATFFYIFASDALVVRAAGDRKERGANVYLGSDRCDGRSHLKFLACRDLPVPASVLNRRNLDGEK